MSDTPNGQPASIPESHRDLIERPIVTTLATTLPEGTPQVTPVWFNEDGGYIYFNTARGRLKDRAMRENPYVAMAVVDPNNPYRYIQIRGPIVEMTEEGGREHINFLNKRYNGTDEYGGPKTETRIVIKMMPEHVQTMG